MRGKDEILKRIQIINHICTKDIIELKGSISEKEYLVIKDAGDELSLLLGYTEKAKNALKAILNISQKELIVLYNASVLEYQQFISNPSHSKSNPYLIVEKIHSIGWVLQKNEWGESPEDIELI